VELGEEGLSRFFSLTSPFLDEPVAAAGGIDGRGARPGWPGPGGRGYGDEPNTLIAGTTDLAVNRR